MLQGAADVLKRQPPETFDRAPLQNARLDFSLLLMFDELVRHERTTVVADRLGLSQSAVSHALTRLRHLFGDPLFSRRPDGLTPTRRALELAPKVRDLMRLAQDVVDGAPDFDPADSDRQFRLAANDLVSTLIGPLLLEKLARGKVRGKRD